MPVNENWTTDENGNPKLISRDVVDDEIISTDQKLKNDKIFCAKLIDVFLIDNRNFPIAFTPTMSMQMMQKFSGVKALSEVGDVKSVRVLLINSVVDDVFTQERKDKYVLMCNNYLGI